MIRLRRQDGQVEDLPTTDAVEITGTDGRVAIVVYQDAKGTIRVLAPGDPLFAGYCMTNRVRAAEVAVHEMFEGKPVPMG